LGNDDDGIQKAIIVTRNPIVAAKLVSKIKMKTNWYDCIDEMIDNVLNLKVEQVPEVLTYLENVRTWI
jgi:hypothetical protein